MKAKPDKRWDARVTYGRWKGSVTGVYAPTWYLARQRAAVLLGADPDEIDVRVATA